jgi:hypothetical protein
LKPSTSTRDAGPDVLEVRSHLGELLESRVVSRANGTSDFGLVRLNTTTFFAWPSDIAILSTAPVSLHRLTG